MSYATLPYKEGQTPTLSLQSTLPRLPVPSLSSSLDRYLKSLRPLLLQKSLKEGKGSENVEKELKIREDWAKDFIKNKGLGLVLQERLIDIDKSTPNNWLDDAFWLKNAYHSWRVPLIINSNWWILIGDEVNSNSKSNELPVKGEFTEFQIKRSSNLVSRLISFKLKLDKEQILPDASRAGPFCMHQYTRVFGLTRIPQLPVDTLVHSPHPHPSTHIIVIANDNYYKLSVLSPSHEPLSVPQLEASIWAIAEDAKTRSSGEGVGVCSGIGRDEWTTTREHLLTSSPTGINRTTLNAIEDSLFVLSLDSHTLKSDHYVTSSPITQTPDLDAHIVNSCSGGGQGKNRWWDKGVSIHVESNGRAGMVGEHSPCDALIPSIVCEYVLAEGIDQSRIGESMRGKEKAVERLEWEVDDVMRSHIGNAVKTVEGLVEDSDAKMLWFDEYGVEWIKRTGKHSPDAYLQMALQLAYYKSHGVAVPTYETASTRLFRHGRTDVIRTLSDDSYKWVTAMMDGKHNPKELYALLTSATKAHNTYTKDSSTGKGCDRHFMGLRLLMREGESHPLFDDPLFGESQSWILSTSGLSAGDKFYGTGFGTVWPEGYGINYLAGNSIIKFGIESKHSSPESSTTLFRQNLIQAMRDMREVCEKGQDVVGGAAKL